MSEPNSPLSPELCGHPATVTVCVTCRHADSDDQSLTGQVLLERLSEAFAQRPALAQVKVIPQRCLMACKRGCTLAMRAPGKMAYVLGDFTPADEAVAAIADYLEQYQHSVDGVVRFALWPQGVKGHFVARLPPPEVDDRSL